MAFHRAILNDTNELVGYEDVAEPNWTPSPKRVRCQRIQHRDAGRVVHLETAPGVVIVAAAWILDPVACAAMGFGAPRVAVSALAELHHLLSEHGFRRSSQDDPTIVQEEHDETPAATGATARSAAPTQHAVRARKASGDEPRGTQDGAQPTGQPPVGGRRRHGGGA